MIFYDLHCFGLSRYMCVLEQNSPIEIWPAQKKMILWISVLHSPVRGKISKPSTATWDPALHENTPGTRVQMKPKSTGRNKELTKTRVLISVPG